MAQVVWTDRALADIADIELYLEAEAGLGTAARFTDKLLAAGDSLIRMADRGRPAPAGTRELIVSPYLIRYRVTRGLVRILRVRHGARRPLD